VSVGELVGCFSQSESDCGFNRHAAMCAHLILSSPPAAADPLRVIPSTKTRALTKTRFRIRSIAQSALADCAKDEVGTLGPPSWFETARALNIKRIATASRARASSHEGRAPVRRFGLGDLPMPPSAGISGSGHRSRGAKTPYSQFPAYGPRAFMSDDDNTGRSNRVYRPQMLELRPASRRRTMPPSSRKKAARSHLRMRVSSRPTNPEDR
jgi:hypothetical protein